MKQDGTEDRFNDIISIYQIYSRLPVRDKKTLSKAYQENFGRYGIDITVKAICPACSNVEDLKVDISSALFRMVYQP